MALAIVEVERRLPYAPADLCALVADIRAYPRFIPWLKRLDVVSERQDGDAWLATARAWVGWGALAETFTTQVKARAGQIDVALVSGPFRRLENHWRFEPAPGGTAMGRSRYIRRVPPSIKSCAADRMPGPSIARL